jgi:carboxymethylenebutenolidase
MHTIQRAGTLQADVQADMQADARADARADPQTDAGGPRAPARRAFIKTSLASGFAAAVIPVEAQSLIHTDAAGLLAGAVSIPVDGQAMPAYRAAPVERAHAPVVLVVQEIFGVHEHIKDVCRRLAKRGYFAVAPELYARQGDPSKYEDVPTLVREIVAKVPDKQVLGDLDASAAWAATQGGDTQRLGITGFCWGGRITWLYAAHNPGLRAGVAWYGRLVGEATPGQPRHPVDIAAQLKAPVLGLYGGADAGIGVDTVERMQSALAQGAPGSAAARSRIVVYPDTPHAFHADYRPSYRKAAAEDGWQRCLQWLAANGVA